MLISDAYLTKMSLASAQRLGKFASGDEWRGESIFGNLIQNDTEVI